MLLELEKNNELGLILIQFQQILMSAIRASIEDEIWSYLLYAF